MDFEFDDSPKYRKKKPKKTPKKADHRHDYTLPVAVKWEFMPGRNSYCLGYKCSICGKITFDDSWTAFKNRVLFHTDEEVKAACPDVEIIEGNPFDINKN